MNRPHIPELPRRLRIQIRPFQITLIVVIAIHIGAFFLFFRDGDAGGSASATRADQSVGKADVTWQDINALVPDPTRNQNPDYKVWVPPVAGRETASVAPLAPRGDQPPVTPDPPGRPVENEIEAPVGGVLPANLTPAREPVFDKSLPILAAKAVEDSVGSEPGAPSDGTGTGFGDGANAGFDFGAYDLLITKEFHKAWVQPLGVDTPFRRNVAKLAVTIGRDGKVDRFSLAKLTGVRELDSSVLAAARSVRRIAPLPDDYRGDTYDVVINFQLD